MKKLAMMTPTIAPNMTPPKLDPTTTPTETPESLGKKGQMSGQNGVGLTGLLLRRRGKTGIWPPSSTVHGSPSPGKVVGVGQTDKEWRCPREGNSPVDRVLVIRHDLVWGMESRGNDHGVRRPAIFWGQRDVRTLRWISVGEWGGSGSGYIT